MVLFNYSTRELTAKIVYYGPGLCGKTTNLQFVYSSLPDGVKKGKMLSLATKTDRTLFFDFLPIELGTIRGMHTRVQLYTVPGQVFYNSTRKLVLKGADGVVFVADSQGKMLEANIESYRNLDENLREMGIRIEEIPLVMQFNKRDLPNLASIEEMNTRINRHNAPFYEAVAMTGIGVEDTLKAVTKLVLNNLSSKYRLEEGAGAGARDAAAEAPATRAARSAYDEKPVRRGSDGPRAAAMPPEDRALNALSTAGGSASESDDVIDLVDEMAPEPQAGAEEVFELEDDVLEDAEPEPTPVTVHPSAMRPGMRPGPASVPAAGARGASAQAVAARAISTEDETLDDEDPIDLMDEIDPNDPSATLVTPLAIGTVSPGQEREIEIPVRVDLDGRSLQILLRLKVRLSG
jgi:signal recognition particle receptor subunit beta